MNWRFVINTALLLGGGLSMTASALAAWLIISGAPVSVMWPVLGFNIGAISWALIK